MNNARRWYSTDSDKGIWTALYAINWFVLLRPLLYRLDPERVHHLVMGVFRLHSEVLT